MRNLIIFAALILLSGSAAAQQKELKRELVVLDRLLDQRQTFIDNHEHRIESLKEVLYNKSDLSDQQRYLFNSQLIEAYAPYQADSTIAYLCRNIELASRMGDKSALQTSRIRLARFYSAIGSYLEAEQLLSKVDTAALAASQLVRYYEARHKLNDELQLYSHDAQQKELSLRKTEYYSRKIIENSNPESTESLNARLWQAIHLRNYDEAETLTETLLAQLPELSREYATAAYMKALVADLKGDDATKQIWFARSAMNDIQLAIRDNAALNSLARTLFNADVKRSMGYIRVAMEDARFFNSQLRPWQDAYVLSTIEQAYSERQKREAQNRTAFTVLLIFFLLFAITGIVVVFNQNNRLKSARRSMERAYDMLNSSNDELKRFNERLMQLNDQISETNEVKEEYIGIFLMMCSEYIDRIMNNRRYVRKMLRDGKVDELKKEFLSSNGSDDRELKDFYAMFDATFLRLYPTFIEEFNSLLNEESRIEVDKEEHLTTELRIFALIRLGIDDSSKIAALLRYSVSTIYNYRSKIKCHSNISRDEFEQRIRTIGAFYHTPAANRNDYLGNA